MTSVVWLAAPARVLPWSRSRASAGEEGFDLGDSLSDLSSVDLDRSSGARWTRLWPLYRGKHVCVAAEGSAHYRTVTYRDRNRAPQCPIHHVDKVRRLLIHVLHLRGAMKCGARHQLSTGQSDCEAVRCSIQRSAWEPTQVLQPIAILHRLHLWSTLPLACGRSRSRRHAARCSVRRSNWWPIAGFRV